MGTARSLWMLTVLTCLSPNVAFQRALPGTSCGAVDHGMNLLRAVSGLWAHKQIAGALFSPGTRLQGTPRTGPRTLRTPRGVHAGGESWQSYNNTVRYLYSYVDACYTQVLSLSTCTRTHADDHTCKIRVPRCDLSVI